MTKISSIGAVAKALAGQAASAPQRTATVQTGETSLAQVANRLGLGENALRQANPTITGSLKPGQALRLPQNVATPPKLMSHYTQMVGTRPEPPLKNLLFDRKTALAPGQINPGAAAALGAALKKEAVQSQLTDQFRSLAADSVTFHNVMRDFFGDNYNRTVAEDMRLHAMKGDFSFLPALEFVSGNQLRGLGAAPGRLYISDRLVDSNGALTFAQLGQILKGALASLRNRLDPQDAGNPAGRSFETILASGGPMVVESMPLSAGKEETARILGAISKAIR